MESSGLSKLFLQLLLVVGLAFSLASGAVGQEVKKKAKDPWFGKDKLKHFVVSAVVAGAGYYVAHSKMKMKKENARAASAGVTLGLGLGKEYMTESIRTRGFPDGIWRLTPRDAGPGSPCSPPDE